MLACTTVEFIGLEEFVRYNVHDNLFVKGGNYGKMLNAKNSLPIFLSCKPPMWLTKI